VTAVISLGAQAARVAWSINMSASTQSAARSCGRVTCGPSPAMTSRILMAADGQPGTADWRSSEKAAVTRPGNCRGRSTTRIEPLESNQIARSTGSGANDRMAAPSQSRRLSPVNVSSMAGDMARRAISMIWSMANSMSWSSVRWVPTST